jgi:hypothetical protein
VLDDVCASSIQQSATCAAAVHFVHCYSSVGIATSLRAVRPRNRGSVPDGGNRFFSTASSRSRGLTQPPLQWVRGALSPRIKWRGLEAHHSHLVTRLRMMELYLHSPIQFYGVVLN